MADQDFSEIRTDLGQIPPQMQQDLSLDPLTPCWVFFWDHEGKIVARRNTYVAEGYKAALEYRKKTGNSSVMQLSISL